MFVYHSSHFRKVRQEYERQKHDREIFYLGFGFGVFISIVASVFCCVIF